MIKASALALTLTLFTPAVNALAECVVQKFKGPYLCTLDQRVASRINIFQSWNFIFISEEARALQHTGALLLDGKFYPHGGLKGLEHAGICNAQRFKTVTAVISQHGLRPVGIVDYRLAENGILLVDSSSGTIEGSDLGSLTVVASLPLSMTCRPEQ